jgi:hypothetical protein
VFRWSSRASFWWWKKRNKKKNKTKYVREKEMYRCNKPITDTDTHKKTDCQSTGETRSSY